jgi:hypothetical protein
MQHIGLRLESEGGGVIKKSEINFVDIVLYLIESDKEKTLKLLWSVDPYGLTVINNLQIEQLVTELESLAQKAPEVKNKINEVISLAKEVKNHIYLKFIGD